MIFTKENSRLAALLHGDPNEVHLNQRFGKTIAPGIMQLQGFIALNGWTTNTIFDLELINPLMVPCNADFSQTENGYSVIEGNKVYSIGHVKPGINPNLEIINPFTYTLTREDIDPETLDWKTYSKIPVNQVKTIIPKTDEKTLEKVAAIGVAANALVRYLYENPSFLPEIFFPQARENGKYALLEQRLELCVGDFNPDSPLKEIKLGIAPTIELDDKTFISSIRELNNLYTLDIHLKKIPKRIFERLLR